MCKQSSFVPGGAWEQGYKQPPIINEIVDIFKLQVKILDQFGIHTTSKIIYKLETSFA